MKIELKSPINHDNVEFGRGAHDLPDSLAKRFLAFDQGQAVLFIEGKNNCAWGLIEPANHSKHELQKICLERIETLRRQTASIAAEFPDLDLGLTEEVAELLWLVRSVNAGNSTTELLEAHTAGMNRRNIPTTGKEGNSVEAAVEKSTALKRSRQSGQVTQNSSAIPRNRNDYPQSKMTASSKNILALLRELSLIKSDGSLIGDHASIDRFCIAADRKRRAIQLPTGKPDNWMSTWQRTLDSENGYRVVSAYLRALVKRGSQISTQ